MPTCCKRIVQQDCSQERTVDAVFLEVVDRLLVGAMACTFGLTNARGLSKRSTLAHDEDEWPAVLCWQVNQLNVLLRECDFIARKEFQLVAEDGLRRV